MDLLGRVLSQLEGDSTQAAALRDTGQNRQVPVDLEGEGNRPRMDRIFNMGPSPIKDSPQARFKEAVLGIRSNAGANGITSRASMPPPLPSYPPPPLPPLPPPELPARISAPLPYYPYTRAMAMLEADTVGSALGELDLSYGRLSPPSSGGGGGGGGGGMLDIRPAAPRMAAATHTHTPAGIGPARQTGKDIPSSVLGKDPGYLYGDGTAFKSPSGQGIPVGSIPPPPAKQVVSDNTLTTHASASAPVSSGGAVKKQVPPNEPSNTQLLSLECQKRRFNPQWDETHLPNGEFKCTVLLKDQRVSGTRAFRTASAAKQAVAYKAWNIVRRWPIVEAVPNAIQKVLNAVKDGKPPYNATAPQAGPPKRSSPKQKREVSAASEPSSYTHKDLTKLISQIEATIGESIPHKVKTNPVAAKAYLAGFAVGSQCAGTAARGSSRETSAKDRSRSRSPRRTLHTDPANPKAGYRERSVSRDASGHERLDGLDRYRPVPCILPSSDNFRPHHTYPQAQKDSLPPKSGE